jgi:hypothetical protein
MVKQDSWHESVTSAWLTKKEIGDENPRQGDGDSGDRPLGNVRSYFAAALSASD